MRLSRRGFIGLTTGTMVSFRNETLGLVEKALRSGGGEPVDEDFWIQIQEGFSLDRTLVNLNNGGCSPSPRVVQEALERYQRLSNQGPSYYMWRQVEPQVEHVRARLARMFGVDKEEIAITRNASESLENLLFGLPLATGDEVLTTTYDYPRMITTLKQRERRDGIKLVQVEPAVHATQGEIVQALERGLTPRTKLILVSQVGFMNGQVYPVRQVVEMGRKASIPVVVDGAHAFAQFPIDRKDLGCDFYGASLHKWLMAPMGTGLLFIAKPKIEQIWPLMAAPPESNDNIRKFEEIGTHPAAPHNAIAEAIEFHELIGAERKFARLLYLRDRWSSPLRENKKFKFHSPMGSDRCVLTTVEIEGLEHDKLAGWLLDKKGIVVTGIAHPLFKGIRVTPSVYTTLGELDRFSEAMLEAATKGI